MKKKTMMLLIFLAMMLLIGCGGKAKGVKQLEVIAQVETSTEVEKTKEEVIEPEVFEIQVTEGFENQKCDLDGSIIYDFTSQVVQANLTKYPQTEQALENFFVSRNTEIYNSIDESEYFDNGCVMPMEYHLGITNMREDEDVISFLYGGRYYFGTGTLYNNSYYEGVVFDTVSGKRLGLSDVVYDACEFEKFAKVYVATYICDNISDYVEHAYSIEYLDITPNFYIKNIEYSWYFDNDGIVIICNPSEGDYLTVEDTFVVIPYEEAYDYIKSEYIPDGIVKAENTQNLDLDMLGLLYMGASVDDVALASGLELKTVEYVEGNSYMACGDTIQFTAFGSSPFIAGIKMSDYVEGVTIGGCSVGMDIQTCIDTLGQYGFTLNKEENYCRYKLVNDAEAKYVEIVTISEIVVHIQCGVYESEDDYYFEIYGY